MLALPVGPGEPGGFTGPVGPVDSGEAIGRSLEPLSTATAGATTGQFLGSLAALATTTVVWAAAFFLYGRFVRARGDRRRAIARCRRALRWGLPVAYGTALVAMVAGGWLDSLDAVAASVPGGESAVGDAVSVVVGLSAPAVAVLGAYLGLFPTVTSLRDVDVSAATALGRLARYLVGLIALVALLVTGAFALGAGTTTGVGFFAALLLVLGVLLVGSPWIVRALQTTRAATDDERERLDGLCEDAGLDPRAVRIVETGGAEQAFAFVRGPPGRRHLFVSDYLLDSLDDAHLRAYLALQAGRARLFHLEVRAVIATTSLGLAAALLLGLVSLPDVTDGLAAVAVILAGGIGLWAGQRLVFRADGYAVERTERETVEETLRRYAVLNDAPMTWGRLRAIRGMEPPLVRRIDRLRDRAAGEESPPATEQ